MFVWWKCFLDQKRKDNIVTKIITMKGFHTERERRYRRKRQLSGTFDLSHIFGQIVFGQVSKSTNITILVNFLHPGLGPFDHKHFLFFYISVFGQFWVWLKMVQSDILGKLIGRQLKLDLCWNILTRWLRSIFFTRRFPKYFFYIVYILNCVWVSLKLYTLSF